MDKSQYKNEPGWLRMTTRPLKIIVVGAGIGGLTAAIGLHRTGHHVTVLEQSHHIAEVGAGIQLAPNAARVLARLGMLEEIMTKTNLLARNSIRRYANDEELSTAPLMPQIYEQYGAPLGVIHRGDLQGIILKGAHELDIDIRLNHKVVRVDENFAPRAQVATGEWFEADVIIAADGIKSHIREQMAENHGITDHTFSTGDSAYRILIPREKMEHDQEALALLNENVGMRWLGPGGHIMAYPLKPTVDEKNDKEINMLYNMVLLHPTKLQSKQNPDEESWTNKGSKKEMLDFYSSWAPVIQNLLKYVPEEEVMEWTLNMHQPLPTWTEGKIVLMGDASHPMLPYVAQGAAQAIEDAGVLVETLAKTDNVSLALEVYQEVRKDRAEKIQNSTLDTKKALHLPDGAAQRARDEKIRQAMHGGENPDRWADKSWQHFMYGVDVMQKTRDEWEDLVQRVEGHHAEHVSRIIRHDM